MLISRRRLVVRSLALLATTALARPARAEAPAPAREPPEWGDLLRDLDRPQEAMIEKGGKRIATRTHVKGQVGFVFQAAGVALPRNIREQAA